MKPHALGRRELGQTLELVDGPGVGGPGRRDDEPGGQPTRAVGARGFGDSRRGQTEPIVTGQHAYLGGGEAQRDQPAVIDA